VPVLLLFRLPPGNMPMGGMNMLPAAIGLMLAGFGFIFFTVTAGDLDILIDAVGFLLIFNGVLALRKTHKKLFGGACLLCLPLVAVACLQLFFIFGTAPLLLLGLRAVLEALLYLLLAISMGKALGEERYILAPAARGAFLLNAFGALIWAALSFFSPFTALTFHDVFLLLFHLALLAVLAFILLSVPLASSRALLAGYAAGRVKKQEIPKPAGELSAGELPAEALSAGNFETGAAVPPPAPDIPPPDIE
jgi:hypothetical protein